MTKNKVLFWIFTALASVAVALGFCLLFLGTKKVTELPTGVKIENVDGNVYLSTDFNGEYAYQFKIEQEVGEDFVVLNVVNSKTNSILLEENSVDLQAGTVYRFSARYTAQNGATNTDFCEALTWQASWMLGDVKNIKFNQETSVISWDEVYLADYYLIRLLGTEGEENIYTSIFNSFSMQYVNVGDFQVYISAVSNNQYLQDSKVSDPLLFNVTRKNVILYAVYNVDLNVVCSELVEKFAVFSNGNLIAIVDVENVFVQNNLYYYTLTDAGIFMQDFEKVTIKTLASGYILESDPVELM